MRRARSNRPIVIERLRRWLKRRKFDLLLDDPPGTPWQYSFRTMTVLGTMSEGLGPAVAKLLHECGHILIDRRANGPFSRWESSYELSEGKPPDEWYVTLVQDEMEAWNVALELMKKMKLERYRKDIFEVRARCLMKYIEWASWRGRHEWLQSL